MRSLGLTLVAAGFIFLSGCGCLETWEDRHLTRYGVVSAPDPDQPAWHQWLFGTKYVCVRSVRPTLSADFEPNATKRAE